MYIAIPEQGDLFAPEQYELFHEESPRTSEGFALSDGATSDQLSDFTEAPVGTATT
nr:hypothetical protein [uncultured Pseudogulbenkiania sp.]